ncbi:MAG TPA: c-type cytochrome [Usitatibacter sp.]|nr:c-type cytochrome [Usitatibacter sp.]
MPHFLKLAAAVLVALAALVAAAFAGATWMGERKRNRTVDVRVVPVAPAKDAAALRQGKYLFETRGCAECHGADGRGKVVVEDPNGLLVRAPNITAGRNGAVGAYDAADWVRAIRHGVAPSGRPLLVMPSEDFNRMSDADLAALVAYTRALPPADGEPGEVRLPPHLKALYGLGVIDDAASRIDHRKPPAPPVPAEVSVEHGAYVASMCIGCHGASYSGGPIPGAPPHWPPASNLTPGAGSAMARYPDAAQFAAMMRTGKRPDGSAVSRVMPFASLGQLTDVDLAAMHEFLRRLPARATGER